MDWMQRASAELPLRVKQPSTRDVPAAHCVIRTTELPNNGLFGIKSLTNT
jgi:hypothetical protein